MNENKSFSNENLQYMFKGIGIKDRGKKCIFINSIFLVKLGWSSKENMLDEGHAWAHIRELIPIFTSLNLISSHIISKSISNERSYQPKLIFYSRSFMIRYGTPRYSDPLHQVTKGHGSGLLVSVLKQSIPVWNFVELPNWNPNIEALNSGFECFILVPNPVSNSVSVWDKIKIMKQNYP